MEHAAEAAGEATAAGSEEAQAPVEVPALGGSLEEPEATLRERFTGYDSFTEAMLEHGRTLERPLSWNRWRHVAGQVAPAYPGEPRDANSWSAVRTSTYTTLFGSEARWSGRTGGLTSGQAGVSLAAGSGSKLRRVR